MAAKMDEEMGGEMSGEEEIDAPRSKKQQLLDMKELQEMWTRDEAPSLSMLKKIMKDFKFDHDYLQVKEDFHQKLLLADKDVVEAHQKTLLAEAEKSRLETSNRGLQEKLDNKGLFIKTLQEHFSSFKEEARKNELLATKAEMASEERILEIRNMVDEMTIELKDVQAFHLEDTGLLRQRIEVQTQSNRDRRQRGIQSERAKELARSAMVESEAKIRQLEETSTELYTFIRDLESTITADKNSISVLENYVARLQTAHEHCNSNKHRVTIEMREATIRDLKASVLENLDNMDIDTLKERYNAYGKKIEEMETKALDEKWANMTAAEKRAMLRSL